MGDPWDLIEPYWNSVQIYGSGDEFLADYRALPVVVRHLLTTQWCHSEVCNGGFHQFFANPTGVLAPEAALGFDALGLNDTGSIVREAMAWFGSDYPRDQPVREKQLNSFARKSALPKRRSSRRGQTKVLKPPIEARPGDPFHELDERFYQSLRSPLGTDNWELTASAFARKYQDSTT